MAKININTANRVVPMIYAYSTPEIARHDGWVKIGYTEKQTTEARQKQQAHTVDVILKEEWKGNAIFDDGSGELFHDTDFHAYLRKQNIENTAGTEWFHLDGEASEMHFFKFRKTRGILESLDAVVPYTLRAEQSKAVSEAKAYMESHENAEFLWNAKPRFGKTLSVYDFCKQINAQNVLIVTNRPAIANSWYSDYEKFFGTESGYLFVSNTESLKGKKYCVSREKYVDTILKGDSDYKCIEFVSLQDLKGSVHFGGEHDKLKEVVNMDWDVLVIDEAHEGVDTYKTDVAFNRIKRKFALHLSGTPFKALANDKFPQEAIFNWTYADEQDKKRNWDGENENPYKNLPQLNLFTYQMSDIVKDELDRGIEIQGETEEYAFDLNAFFETNANGTFKYDSSVDKFIDALTTQEKFPFSTEELRGKLKHTFWLLNRVDSAKALAKKLRNHPVFSDYEIVLAAGDGKLDDAEETEKSYDKVVKAIKEHDKTITLSVGQLTTGITIPEWTAVLMLSSIKSPALYMQAAFRAQNPCLFKKDGQFYRKENAYVFDFDPARTLTIFEEFANDLSAETSDGRGDTEKRKENIRELLNFFPVIGEDEEGEMVELDAEKVLSIPRKIRSQEVVKRGFMSDFLFQNISNVFHAPMEVIEIIKQFTPVQEPKNTVDIDANTEKDLSLDQNGNVDISDDYVIGKAANVFGEKIYSNITDALSSTIDEIKSVPSTQLDTELEKLKSAFVVNAVAPLVETAKAEYGKDMRQAETNRLEKKLKSDASRTVGSIYGEYSIRQKELEREYQDALSKCNDDAEIQAQTDAFEEKQNDIVNTLKQKLNESVDTFVQDAGKTIIHTVETEKKEKEKKTIEDSVKDHLRGFSRTIPSFLMAYGDETVTLQSFDTVIPENVFFEVTSITLEQFKFLRDGGDYINTETGETEHFEGKLFDPVVFDDSVKEFLRLKVKLADYFEESNKEDIFDYIPPQKTNQIFTPKWVVKKMVDMLEEENPHCFDDPNKTFIDLYMKSGLYITEIVKKLYQSENMKTLFPNSADRLKHIFEKQVYGLAPSEIIYRIATNFILGFDSDVSIDKFNFKQVDVLPFAENGTLEAELDRIFNSQKSV